MKHQHLIRRNKQKKFNFLIYKRNNNHNIYKANINYTEKQRQAPIQQTYMNEKIQKIKSNQRHTRTRF